MAEELGFEPRRQFPDLPVFKTGPFNHLGIPPEWLGGPCRTRTYDQPVMSRMLWPTELRVQLAKLVAGARLELATFRVWTGCSSQLSYPAVFTILQWSGWQDLNLRPLDPKSSALPSCATSRNISSHRELFFNKMARPVGIEPATFWSVVKRSIQLSYGRIVFRFLSSRCSHQRSYIIQQKDHLCKTFFEFFSFFFIQMQNSLINKGLVPFSPSAFTPLLQD